jgi:hypothetical protein
MPTKRGIEPSSISDEHYSAIGKLVANWAALEAIINSAIWRIGGIQDEIGACVTSQIFTFDAKMKALISILKVHGNLNSTVSSLNKFHDDVRPISNFRNRLVHDPWVHDEITNLPQRLQITSDKKPLFEYIPESITQINETSEKLGELIHQFQKIINRAIAKLPPLPEKQR